MRGAYGARSVRGEPSARSVGRHRRETLPGTAQVSRRFKRTLKRAGVREVRFHDLRHTFGTRCAAAGVPLRTLQAWMGHADIKTTMVYTDYAPGANEAELVNGVFDAPWTRATAPRAKR